MESVYHVATDKQRNTQPGLFHRDALELIDLYRVGLVQNGAYLSLADGIRVVGNVSAR